MAEKEYISYDEIVEECKNLAKRLKNNKFNKIIAITRGGMVPACLLAQFLDIRTIDSIALVSYGNDDRQADLKCLLAPNVEIDEHTLFVDDLYDSGNTYKYIKQQYPQAKCTVIYTKYADAVLDFPATLKAKDKWLVFPWEFDAV
ncbi:MAG: xanthine phosphoribosyltransferase [Alphaproteobacteria bacterium]|nr:xanthine phosphoribosyltransferase [Alphaproteobacteria bacterium]